MSETGVNDIIDVAAGQNEKLRRRIVLAILMLLWTYSPVFLMFGIPGVVASPIARTVDLQKQSESQQRESAELKAAIAKLNDSLERQEEKIDIAAIIALANEIRLYARVQCSTRDLSVREDALRYIEAKQQQYFQLTKTRYPDRACR
jgi:cell division protein FtsB